MAKRYLALIYWNEEELWHGVPPAEMNALNAAHLRLNEDLRRSGHYIEAEALEPAKRAKCLRVKNGKLTISDGPFAESKELVAGFYLIEASDMEEAIRIAARIPSLSHATVEVREVRQLVVEVGDAGV
jgi:hypothetical protein